MTKNYRKTAYTALGIEFVLLAIMIFSYLWLANLILGVFMVLFLVAAGSWVLSLIFTIVLLRKTKKSDLKNTTVKS